MSRDDGPRRVGVDRGVAATPIALQPLTREQRAARTLARVREVREAAGGLHTLEIPVGTSGCGDLS